MALRNYDLYGVHATSIFTVSYWIVRKMKPHWEGKFGKALALIEIVILHKSQTFSSKDFGMYLQHFFIVFAHFERSKGTNEFISERIFECRGLCKRQGFVLFQELHFKNL